ncbi:vasorin-like [Argopecten irradians]|uniref:vasorin-like n=1 Tax=Argopecten irradians TaxID=31199 RepID=UPI003712CFF8
MFIIIRYTILNEPNCEIQSLPLSIRSLRAFDVLSLDSNPNLNLTGDAFVGIQSLVQIYIRNQNFDTFPDIFHDALTVRDVDMSGTPITRFDASLIPENNKLRTISLSDTLLTEIPSAIVKMKQLQNLIIRNSSITSVSRSDFKGLRKLNFIAIQDAPLTSFSDDALNDTRSLQSLLLSNTNLTTIPRAIIGHSRINQLDMGDNPLVCTCSTLGWMKRWEHHSFLVLTGDCANLHNVTLNTYYSENVPKCPEESIIS